MKNIDEMLKQWIHSSLIRNKLRDYITRAIQEAYLKGYRDGGSVGR